MSAKDLAAYTFDFLLGCVIGFPIGCVIGFAIRLVLQ